MEDQDLLQRVCATNEGWLKLGNEVFEAEGATFVRNTLTPRRQDSNHVADVTCSTSAELDRLFARMNIEYAAYDYRRVSVDALTPPEVSARLVLEGYTTGETLIMVLETDVRARPKDVDILGIESEADWAALATQSLMDWQEGARNHGEPQDEALMAEFALARKLKTPPVRGWLAYVDGVPRAHFSSWEGENGVGMVEDLFTHPEYRHRGLATALIARCVADARARGAGPVLIGAGPADTPKHMYAAMGFRPLYLARNFFKTGLPV